MSASNPLRKGARVFIRTITFHYLGEIVEVIHADGDNPVGGYVLASASWVADSGRFGELLASGTFSETAELEPFSDPVFIPAHALIDATPWRHALPTEAR